MSGHIDPLDLSRALIRCPSVTPRNAGTLDVLADALGAIGFTCERLRFEAPGTAPVDNLYARLGDGTPEFCFAGHTDVVPPGDTAAWSVDPFAAEIRDDRLFGRGASDMKAAIACFIAAVSRFVAVRSLPGAISLLITGDEEGPSVNGTTRMLGWLRKRGGPLPDVCLVGEPTNPDRLGEMIKIGRRGSLNALLTVIGTQGHSAYPHLADNPLPRLVRTLAAIDTLQLDEGTPAFQPSTIALTSIDVGNPATNIIPARVEARFNVRFNDLHTGKSVEARLRELCAAAGGAFRLETECSAEAFLGDPGPFSGLIAEAAQAVTGLAPVLSTSGGTSDARFIKDICPVCEFGMVGATAHKVDENIPVADVATLTLIYERVLQRFFAAAAAR